MSRLEELCRPFLALVCSHAAYARAGANIDAGVLRAKALDMLAALREQCAGDAVLRREFERIEKPLVFFADYCLKEGDTPLSRDWSELGRAYSELSGDEKFYDMLTATLEDPEASERLRMFFVMMGLGFDGVHRGDREFVQRRMRLCATRFALSAGDKSALCPDIVTPHVGSRRPHHLLAACLVFSLVFIAVAFAADYYRFCRETRDYREALISAHRQAETKFDEMPHYDTEPSGDAQPDESEASR